MASGCKSVIGCVDDNAEVSIRPTYANRYMPESDAEFVRSLILAEKNNQQTRKPRGPSVDIYSCRQVYLRSYRFKKKKEKESVSQKMMKSLKCFGKLEKKLANFPFAAYKHEQSESLLHCHPFDLLRLLESGYR